VPTSTYALSKVASETVASQIAQWSGIPFVALRHSWRDHVGAQAEAAAP